MYHVLLTEGPDEPWWFFENWEEQVVEGYTFRTFAQAKAKYIDWYGELEKKYPHVKTKDPYMAAFWQEGEYYYCEECSDDLQCYHGLLILDTRQDKVEPRQKRLCPMREKEEGEN